MKLIIAGNRNLTPTCKQISLSIIVWTSIDNITEVVSGKAKGVDTAGEAWAAVKGIPVKEFPADWDRYDKAAGHLRNEQMAKYADAALLFFKGAPSPGTSNMLAWMAILKKPYHVVVL